MQKQATHNATTVKQQSANLGELSDNIIINVEKSMQLIAIDSSIILNI